MSEALSLSVATPLRAFSLEVELSARAGEPHALAGPSGAGKTSLLRVAAGLMAPQRGKVELGGQTWLDTTRSIDLAPERRRCGMVFQEYALFPRMSAWRNVAYGIPGSRAGRRRAAIGMLERFGVGQLAEALPGALSGGERQRVALSRALAARPRALLLDEPLAALDSTTRRRALRELRGVLEELNVPAVFVTHSFEEAALLARSMTIVDRGRVVQSGSPAEISTQPRTVFVADFCGAVVLRGFAQPAVGGLTTVRLPGAVEVQSTDSIVGPVALSVFPWEIALKPSGGTFEGPMLNRVEGRVDSVTIVGDRASVGISIPERLSAEVTAHSAKTMALRPGVRVTAAWKPTATRLIAER
jgi:molybdate transport system ATP-binding protein